MTRRAQAEAVVDMLNSNTMDFSNPGKQRERLIELVEAALAEHAKAAPVSDVGALVERLREGLEGVTPGPWSHCSDKCKCTAVLSAHHPIAEVVKGEWGDEFPSLRFKEGGTGRLEETSIEAYMEKIVYGEIPVEEAMRNRAHIANCSPDNIRLLLDTIATLRQKLERAEAFCAASVSEYKALTALLAEAGKVRDDIIEAWERLPQGHYSPDIIQNWLTLHMAPAVRTARALSAKIKEATDAR